MEDMEDVIQEFLSESREGLDHMERDLLDYERNPADKARLDSLFRVLHTIKGTGGFLGFSVLERLAHSGENVLASLRDGRITMGGDLVALLLELVDILRKGLAWIGSAGKEGPLEENGLTERLKTCLEGASVLSKDVQGTTPTPPEAGPSSIGSMEDNVLRVQAGLLDQLMNLTGEMVLARNQAFQYAASRKDPAFHAVLQPLNQLASRIQENVMKARLQPLSQLWGRFPRLVRDTAQGCGKKARLETQGSETEIDRGLLEAIRDPFTHLLRNAVDHGIEPPDARSRTGKPAEGRILLRAYHESGLVHLEINDDGGGLPLERIRQKAVQQGLVTAGEAEKMGAQEAAQLIFRPGFSTAEKITSISGRGVGLDVVKANLEAIGGKVEVETFPGKGTSFKLKIPLTLATLPALVASCAGQTFIIPRVPIQRIVRIKDDYIHRGIEQLPGGPVYRLEGHLLPLVSLRESLHLPEPAEASGFHIVVLKGGNGVFGLVVDDVVDFQDVVVKPLARQLKPIPYYVGATVLGDRKIALILDTAALARLRQPVPSPGQKPYAEPQGPTAPVQPPTQMALVFQTPDDGRMAIPLEKVLRLEAFHHSAVEVNGDLEVIQYEGRILPLVRVSRLLPERRKITRTSHDPLLDEKLQVVVYADGREEVGLVVDRVLDIVEAPLQVERPASRSLVLGSMVLRQRVTELLDIPAVLTASGIHGEGPHGA